MKLNIISLVVIALVYLGLLVTPVLGLFIELNWTLLGSLFWMTFLFIIICMYMTWTVRKTMQATYWLIMLLVGVSLMYLYALSEILFALQLSIYGGGISVLLLFAALLAEHDDLVFVGGGMFGQIEGVWSQILAFLLLAVNLIGLPLLALSNPDFQSNFQSNIPKNAIGDTHRTVTEGYQVLYSFVSDLWQHYGAIIPFLAMVLLAALLGSVKLVIREWELESLSPEMKERYEGVVEDN